MQQLDVPPSADCRHVPYSLRQARDGHHIHFTHTRIYKSANLEFSIHILHCQTMLHILDLVHIQKKNIQPVVTNEGIGADKLKDESSDGIHLC